MSKNNVDATTVFIERYGINFNEDEAKRLNDFFNHKTDIKGNLRYRMFNNIRTFKDAIDEHTIIQASRLHPTHIRLIIREFELHEYPKSRWLDVDYGVSIYKPFSRIETETVDENITEKNIIIMSESTIDGAKIDKRYEVCIYNPELDLVTDSIRFV